MEAIKRIMGLGTIAATSVAGALVIVTSSGVTVEDSDVTNVSTANGYFLTSSFGLLKFLAPIAVLAGGVYVLDKVFALVPHGKK